MSASRPGQRGIANGTTLRQPVTVAAVLRAHLAGGFPLERCRIARPRANRHDFGRCG